MSPVPYYADDSVQLYLGDCREILPELDLTAGLVCADPPYGETSLAWDRWPTGWPTLAAAAAPALWCFGSMRTLLDRVAEFTAAGWRLSQDIVWEKPNGTGFARDRFRRVHEHATHWYRGPWAGVHHEVPRHPSTGLDKSARRTTQPQHTGAVRGSAYVDDGTRLARSVQMHRSLHSRGAIHPTEKPIELLDQLIRYACPSGGLVLDPFAGSGSTLDAARRSGRRAVGIEADERYAEAAARRLQQTAIPTTAQEI